MGGHHKSDYRKDELYLEDLDDMKRQTLHRPGTPETEFWGELTKHENGEVTYSPTSTEP
jgi:hypothetical protein